MERNTAIVFQDYVTKWPEVYALSDCKAESVTHAVSSGFSWCHGVPSRVIHHAEFLSDVLWETAH